MKRSALEASHLRAAHLEHSLRPWIAEARSAGVDAREGHHLLENLGNAWMDYQGALFEAEKEEEQSGFSTMLRLYAKACLIQLEDIYSDIRTFDQMPVKVAMLERLFFLSARVRAGIERLFGASANKRWTTDYAAVCELITLWEDAQRLCDLDAQPLLSPLILPDQCAPLAHFVARYAKISDIALDDTLMI